jgi:DNA-directed RNA polymerases I, II, and III subunit RPABC1
MNKHYTVCKEMLTQRGATISEETDDMILAYMPDNSPVCVFISSTNKFNVDSIQEYVSLMHQMDVTHSIIIYKEGITSVAKKIVDELSDMTIELFSQSELSCNITKHVMVPKHELAFRKGSVGLKEFKAKYSDNFPVLLKNDPVSRFYGFCRGDLVRIIRKGGIVMYRIVK